jgi:sulfur transfer complex TusBCD TusB component (DsrH family)
MRHRVRDGKQHGVFQPRPFFHLQDGVMVKTHDAEPDRALALTEPALEVYKREEAKALNIEYHRLVRSRAESLEALDENERAKAELATLHDDLEARGVNETVLADIKAYQENL